MTEFDSGRVIRPLQKALDESREIGIDAVLCSTEIVEKVIELLKEQEPLKPKSKVRHGKNGQIQHFCRKCNAILFHHKQKFCIECGQAVKWE